MSELFERDEKAIRKHINKVFSVGELERNNNMQKMRVDGVKQTVAFYDLDVILYVGYIVNSPKGIAFRRWANSVLKQYIIQGYAINDNRMFQLGQVLRLMKSTENILDAKQVLTIIEKYNVAIERKAKVSTLPVFPELNINYYTDDRFNIGIRDVQEGRNHFRIYDMEKTVVDIVYYREKVGIEETKEILINYLRRDDRDLNRLIRYA